jgi:hypothetical protein
MPPVEGVRPDEVEGAGDVAPRALGHDEQDAVIHRLTDDGEKGAREIGAAPFARSGFHVEIEKGIPGGFRERRTAQPLDGDTGVNGVAPLAADRLALAGGQR